MLYRMMYDVDMIETGKRLTMNDQNKTRLIPTRWIGIEIQIETDVSGTVFFLCCRGCGCERHYHSMPDDRTIESFAAAHRVTCGRKEVNQ